MPQVDTQIILILIITLLLGIIAWLNHRINQLDYKIDLLGGLSFSLIDTIAILNTAERDTIRVLKKIMPEDDSDLDKSLDNLEKLGQVDEEAGKSTD